MQNPRAITERQFQQQIADLAKLFGWKYYHTWKSFHSPAGFPDCVLVRKERLVLAELKSEVGKVSPAQQEWLDAIRLACKEVYLWRPSDWDELVEILR